MNFFSLILCLLSLAATSSCIRPSCEPNCNYMILGEEEFEGESELIANEGKFGIIALEGHVFQDFEEEALCPYIDRIAENDVLNVVIFHPSRRDLMDSIADVCNRLGGFKVTNGQVTIPDFPPFKVEGLTLEEARKQMTDYLRAQVNSIEVFVTFRERPSHKIELMGLVARDSIEADGRIRLYEVLAKSHLPPHANLYASYILRDDRPLKIDMNRLVKEGDMSQNIVMRAGDKIYIGDASQKTAYVMGEVNTPRTIPLVTGSISLREALSIANGIPYSGDERNIQIIRTNTVCPKIFVISMQCVLSQPNDRLLLIPGDVVYVSRTHIRNWNLFINDLMPTINAVFQGTQIYRVTR